MSELPPCAEPLNETTVICMVRSRAIGWRHGMPAKACANCPRSADDPVIAAHITALLRSRIVNNWDWDDNETMRRKCPATTAEVLANYTSRAGLEAAAEALGEAHVHGMPAARVRLLGDRILGRDMSPMVKQARTTEAARRAKVPCRHRSATIRTQKKTCCGLVEWFNCAAVGREVMSTKCRTCPSYLPAVASGEAMAGKPADLSAEGLPKAEGTTT